MNASARLDPPTRHAPLALWRVAEAFMQLLYNLFGEPQHIAAQGALTGLAHKQLASWLRCAEALLRRLLLIEAAAFPKPNTRPLLHAPRQRARKLRYFTADKPEDWRVSFRILDRPRSVIGIRLSVIGSRPPKTDPRSPKTEWREDRWSYENFAPVKLRDAWPLAERYEAVLRVFANPEPYARRLSRRLHAAPHRRAEALRAPPEAEHRIDAFERIGAFAEERWRCLDSS